MAQRYGPLQSYTVPVRFRYNCSKLTHNVTLTQIVKNEFENLTFVWPYVWQKNWNDHLIVRIFSKTKSVGHFPDANFHVQTNHSVRPISRIPFSAIHSDMSHDSCHMGHDSNSAQWKSSVFQTHSVYDFYNIFFRKLVQFSCWCHCGHRCWTLRFRNNYNDSFILACPIRLFIWNDCLRTNCFVPDQTGFFRFIQLCGSSLLRNTSYYVIC